jgi:hypothetical protein
MPVIRSQPAASGWSRPASPATVADTQRPTGTARSDTPSTRTVTPPAPTLRSQPAASGWNKPASPANLADTQRTTGVARKDVPPETRTRSADLATRGTGRTVTRFPTPETRITPPTASYSRSPLRIGGSGDTRAPSALSRGGTSGNRLLSGPAAGAREPTVALRGGRPSDDQGRSASGSGRGWTIGDRYDGGRNRVYNAPGGHPSSRHGAPSYSQNRHGDSHHGHHDNHHGHTYFNPWTFRHCHNAFAPVWYGPVAYPVSGFGFSYSSSSWGLSFSSYSYAPAYSHTRYYDSWHCGGWGYSGVYYGGWRHGWYGGFSYVYNPWPVYRTYYLYDPYPVTETVYVTQPATTTYVVQAPAPTATTVVEAAPVTASVYPTVAAPQAVQSAPATEPVAWEVAPAVDRVENAAAGCLCPCHCNGQRPCICAYPCGAEYAIESESFDLSDSYLSYAESLDPETIWTSYAGLDRWDPETQGLSYEATASATPSSY